MGSSKKIQEIAKDIEMYKEEMKAIETEKRVIEEHEKEIVEGGVRSLG